MNLEQFSTEAFDRLDSPVFVRALADQLQEEVLLELHPIIEQAIAKIVAQLNEMGHNLTPYDPLRPGEYAFRDEVVQNKESRLRLACDVVISAGFADTRR